jgi:hypothetical protein
MMSVLPTAFSMSIAPPALNPTTTTAAVVFSGSTFTFDVPGTAVRSG